MIDDTTYAGLKQNLLELTAAVAPHYDQSYDAHFLASRAYRQFEDDRLAKAIRLLHGGGGEIFADLGCATGYHVFRASSKFTRLYGYDLSPHMIEQAERKLNGDLATRVSFKELDLEGGIPLKNCSVACLVMGLGTASDIRNIRELLVEIQRVLVRGGQFLLSFYNRDALVYSWQHLPWPTSIAAEMDHARSCLKVHVDDADYDVYARAYTGVEIRALMPQRLTIKSMETFPAITAILPEDALADAVVQERIITLDRELADRPYGAYHVVVGERHNFD